MDELCSEIITVMHQKIKPLSIYQISEILNKKESQIRYHVKNHLQEQGIVKKKENKYTIEEELFSCIEGHFMLKLDSTVTLGYCPYHKECKVKEGEVSGKCKKQKEIEQLFSEYISSQK